MNQQTTKKSQLEAEIDAYKGRYGVINQYFQDILGRDGKPMCSDTYVDKRRGVKEFTWREVKALAEVLGMTWEEIDAILPDVNR